MKQETFIELLNLYLDGELKPGEAAELEQEILRNVERRRIYRQYCKMQRACTVLADRFRDEASPAAAAHAHQGRAFSHRSRSGRLRGALFIASGAVAAGLVFVAVRVSFFPTSPTAASPVTAGPATVPVMASNRTPSTHPIPIVRDALALLANPWGQTNPGSERLLVLQPLNTTNSLLEATPPLPVLHPAANSLQFEFQSWSTDGHSRIYRGHVTPSTADPELSAFQFQR